MSWLIHQGETGRPHAAIRRKIEWWRGWFRRRAGQAARVPVVLAGIVSGLRIQQTRRGRMAIITLDDGGAQVELTVFNEIYEASRPWIKEDELLVVRGKASLDELFRQCAGQRRRAVRLRLGAFPLSRKQLALRCNGNASAAQLKQIFTPYRDGLCPVHIHYQNDKRSCQLRLGEAWQVTLPR